MTNELRSTDGGPADVVDGRTARARRTRRAIVDACIDLVVEGDYRPTGPRVAERAGVSLRSVYQHFDDLDALFAEVATRQLGRVQHLVAAIDSGLPLEQRVDELVAQRTALLEAMAPFRRAADVHVPSSPFVAEALKVAQQFLRDHTSHVFEREITSDDILDALDGATCWATWDHLVTMGGGDAARARVAMARLVRGALVTLDVT